MVFHEGGECLALNKMLYAKSLVHERGCRSVAHLSSVFEFAKAALLSACRFGLLDSSQCALCSGQCSDGD